MSDLISRDELIKELEAHCNNVSGDVDSVIGQTYRMAYQHAIEVVKIYPPAYDVEKVVAELECRENFYHNCALGEVLENGHTLDAEGFLSKKNAYSDAIDIVKRGGVSNEYDA